MVKERVGDGTHSIYSLSMEDSSDINAIYARSVSGGNLFWSVMIVVFGHTWHAEKSLRGIVG